MPKAADVSDRRRGKPSAAVNKRGAKVSRTKSAATGRGKVKEIAAEAVGPTMPPVRATGLSETGTQRKPPRRKTKRLPPRKTFLVAATIPEGVAEAGLHVYAVVKRSPAEALSVVRGLLGDDVKVEMTGKLSGRMSKMLGLKPDEIRRI